jgi:SH3-like domain-containing protein
MAGDVNQGRRLDVDRCTPRHVQGGSFMKVGKPARWVCKLLTLGVLTSLVACMVEESSRAPTEECRTVVRRRADVDACVTRCNDDGCRTHCREQETWSRQHRCWLE